YTSGAQRDSATQRREEQRDRSLPVTQKLRISLKKVTLPHLRDLKLQVEEAAKTWLQPERCSSEEVVRRVSLQKFLSLLPPGAQEKTRKQQPQNLEEALIMAACFMEDNRVEQEEPERDRQVCETQTETGHGYSGEHQPVSFNELCLKQDTETIFHPVGFSLEVSVVHPIVNDSNEMSLPGTCYGNKSTTPSLRSAYKNCDRQVQHHKPEAPVKHALECPTCGSKFKRFDYLQRHRCTPGQSLGCKHCDLRFPTLTQLTNHLRIHRKMLRCPVCNKTFRDRLLEHRNIHTGEKPFQCPVCRKGFRHSRTLSKHVVLHSEKELIESKYV
uniref:Zinc finger protein 397-like n=1 Tax=Astyanax mexicanus TaxID=7994 RepID=A0A3B1KF74_ASTMX